MKLTRCQLCLNCYSGERCGNGCPLPAEAIQLVQVPSPETVPQQPTASKDEILSGKKKPKHRRMDLRNLPEFLKQLPRWVLWKWEQRYSKMKGKRVWTKVPFDPKTGKHAKANDAETWGGWPSIQWLIAHKPNPLKRFDGLGFFFHKDDGLFGVDLDDCRDPETGAIKPWALPIIAKFRTYGEVSPSGTGCKLIGKGKKPEDVGCRTIITEEGVKVGEIEVYHTGRYFTLTGEILPDSPRTIENRQEELDEFCRELFPVEKPKPQEKTESANRPRVSLNLTDEQLLDRARNNRKSGAQFRALYDHGDVGSYGNDHSRADLGLCCRLAYWLGRDFHRIDAAFRQSALHREKWGREDYRRRTIEMAIAGCSRTYEEDTWDWRQKNSETQNAANAGSPKPAKPEKRKPHPTFPAWWVHAKMHGIPREELTDALAGLGFGKHPFGSTTCCNPWDFLGEILPGVGRDGSSRKNVGCIQQRQARCGRCSGSRFCPGCWSHRRQEILTRQAWLADQNTRIGDGMLYQIRLVGTLAERRRARDRIRKQAWKIAALKGLPLPGGDVRRDGKDAWILTSTVRVGDMEPVSFRQYVDRLKSALESMPENPGGKRSPIVTCWGAWYGIGAAKREDRYLKFLGVPKSIDEVTELAAEMDMSWQEKPTSGFWLYVREFQRLGEVNDDGEFMPNWKHGEFIRRALRSRFVGGAGANPDKPGNRGCKLSDWDEDFKPQEPPDDPPRRWAG